MQTLVIGNFSQIKSPFDGQTTKTLNVLNVLKKSFPTEIFKLFDYSKYRTKIHLVFLFFNLKKALKKIDSVIIFPGGERAVKFLTYFLYFNYKKNKISIFYPVVGGWLPETISRNNKLIKLFSIFSGIYVETNKMKNRLEKFGMNNIYYSPVFSLRTMISDNKLISLKKNLTNTCELKLCTFSRVCYEKGIELAINATSNVSKKTKQKISLDIYGKIDKSWSNELERIISKNKNPYLKIKCLGAIPDDKVMKLLSNHHALLFPTFYKGEGFPATLLESYMAALPVIASKWANNDEIVIDGVTGFLFSLENNDLEERINWCLSNREILISMKDKCLLEAKKYTPEVALAPFLKDFRKKNEEKQT